MKFVKTLFVAGLIMAWAGLTSANVHAATVVWDFNLPATSVFSQTPPYPTVATLTLVDTSDGVQFTLDPDETNPGYHANSTVDALNIVFTGADDLPSSAYVPVNGPIADASSFQNQFVAVVPPPNSAMNMDSSYKSASGQLLLTWNNPDFNVSDTSVWLIEGTTIADNFSILATSNSNPSPAFGIFSVSPISLDSIKPTPSNWVTGPAPVPIPSAVWLFGPALLSLVAVTRRKTRFS